MNPDAPTMEWKVGLPPEQFAAAFPFHLALDRELCLIQVGSTLRRICPDLQIGVAFSQVFETLRPEGCILSFEAVRRQTEQFFLLNHRASQLQLRGGFVVLPDREVILFLGSPWMTDTAEIAARGLGFEDFAVHDPVVDLLQVFQASKIALADAKKLAAKLTTQRAELRAANERLRTQEAEARKLALIVARTDNAVVLTDAEGRTEWVNEGFVRLTGYTLAEIRGRKPGDLLQGPGTDARTTRRIGGRLREGAGFSAELLNYHRNGRSYWVAIEVQPIHDQEGRLTNFMAIETDITERRAAQQRLAIQFEVSRALAGATSLTTAIPSLLQAVCESFEWQLGQCWTLEGTILKWSEAWRPPNENFPNLVGLSQKTEFEQGTGLPGRAWQQGQAVWVQDVEVDEHFPRATAAKADGLRGGFAFPVFARGELWGVLEFFSRNLAEPDESMLKTITAVGRQIGQFIVRREAEEALREAHTLQRAILEGANYAIISTDPQGIIRTFNSGAERMLRYLSQEVVGKQTLSILHDPEEIAQRAVQLSAELGRKVEPGFGVFAAKASLWTPDEREWTYVRKDGSRFPVRVSITGLFDDSGSITGYLAVGSDITESRRAAVELVKAKEAAEAANRAKSDFLAMMSHEIRTPMNAVLGMTNLLLETPLDRKQTEFARTVARSGEALIEIINDILDFSKIESGEHFQLEEETFSLHRLLEDVVDLLRSRAESKNVSLKVSVAPGIPDALWSDDGRLRQVLVNLVGNGLKFTDRGGVTVHVGCVSSEAERVRLRFEVEDTGIGMSAEAIAQIFRPFTQVDSSPTRRRGGTGLGLAISKKIVESMGGRIGVESTAGVGSRFWFELTLKVAATPTAQPAGSLGREDGPRSGSLTAGSASPLRILVAEDHDTNRRLALFMLENLGHRADFAGNGIEAVKAWERSDYDVILMDCQMPEMDGFEATRVIRQREAARQDPSEKRVRIIALTANALQGDRERCLAAGMDGYISKPFTAQHLAEGLGLRWTRPSSVAEPHSASVPKSVSLDPQRPTQLCAELGEEAVRAIMEEFLADLPRQAAELLTSGPTPDPVQIARVAHSLQGVSFSFGLVRFGEHLRAVEAAAQGGERSELGHLLSLTPGLLEEARAGLRVWLQGREPLQTD